MSIKSLETSLEQTQALLKDNEHRMYQLSSKEEKVKIFINKVCASQGLNGNATEEQKREAMEKFARGFSTKPLIFSLKEVSKIPQYIAQKAANYILGTLPADWTEEEIAQELGRRKIASNGDAHDLLPEVLDVKYLKHGGNAEWGYHKFKKIGQRDGNTTYKMWIFGDPSLENSIKVNYTVEKMKDSR